jgi:integrase
MTNIPDRAVSAWRVGNRWRVRETMPDGTVRSINVKAREKFEAIHLATLAWQEESVKQEAGMLLSEAIERAHHEQWRHLRDARAPRARATAWLDYLGDVPIKDLTSKEIASAAEELRDDKDITVATVNRHLQALRFVLRRAHLVWEEIDRVPAIGLHREPALKDRYVSEQEEVDLIEELFIAGHKETGVFLQACLATGGRASEILGLTEQDLEVSQAGHLQAVFFRDTKSGKPRRVPVPNKYRLVLEGHLPLTYGYAYHRHRFAAACSARGIRGVTIHTLRHTYASRFLQGGGEIEILSRLLGHSKLEVTRRYAHLASANFDKAVSQAFTQET